MRSSSEPHIAGDTGAGGQHRGSQSAEANRPIEGLVWCFPGPHPIGSVCVAPCKHCGETPKRLTTSYVGGQPVERRPLFILAPATREQWQACVKRDFDYVPAINPRDGPTHFYFVHTD